MANQSWIQCGRAGPDELLDARVESIAIGQAHKERDRREEQNSHDSHQTPNHNRPLALSTFSKGYNTFNLEVILAI